MAQPKVIYDFNSVGLQQDVLDKQQSFLSSPTPVGILTPVSFDNASDATFTMTSDFAVQIKDNLRNLLSTNHGERLMLNDFGANLRPLSYDFSSEETVSQAIANIASAVSKYMPFVSLETFEPVTEAGEDGATLLSKIRVIYSVPVAKVTNQVVEATIVVAS